MPGTLKASGALSLSIPFSAGRIDIKLHGRHARPVLFRHFSNGCTFLSLQPMYISHSILHILPFNPWTQATIPYYFIAFFILPSSTILSLAYLEYDIPLMSSHMIKSLGQVAQISENSLLRFGDYLYCVKRQLRNQRGNVADRLQIRNLQRSISVFILRFGVLKVDM